MRKDHVSYTTSYDQLADTSQRLGACLGACLSACLRGTVVGGNNHLSFGSRNFTLLLQNGDYIELVCPLDHTSSDLTLNGHE